MATSVCPVMSSVSRLAPIDPAREYQVAGWASVNEGTEGPPIWDVVANYLARQKTVRLEPNRAVKVTGA